VAAADIAVGVSVMQGLVSSVSPADDVLESGPVLFFKSQWLNNNNNHHHHNHIIPRIHWVHTC